MHKKCHKNHVKKINMMTSLDQPISNNPSSLHRERRNHFIITDETEIQ